MTQDTSIQDHSSIAEDKDISAIQKSFQFEAKDLQTDEDKKIGKFTGYASTFGNTDRDGDIITRGAFEEIISTLKQVPMLWGHDSYDPPIGKFLNFRTDEIGLKVDGEINLQTERGKEIFALVKQGDINTMSIGFIPDRKFTDVDENSTARTFNKIKELFEVSLVNIPANKQAIITEVKSIKDIDSIRTADKFLKQKGLSNKEAADFTKQIANIAIKEFTNSEGREARTESKQSEQNSKREACEKSKNDLLQIRDLIHKEVEDLEAVNKLNQLKKIINV